MSLETELDPSALQGLFDHHCIGTLIHRYCRSVDRIDPELGHSVFHADATADYGDFYQGSGYGAVDAICESHRSLVVHSHQITTTTIKLEGDRAGSEAYHIAAIRMIADGRLMQVTVWGRYLDRWSRRDGRWGIEHRQVIRDLDEIHEVTPLTSGVTAVRSTDCPSYALLGLSLPADR